MTTFTETFHAGGFIVSEAEKTRSREQIAIVSGAGKLTAGTVLGKLLNSAGAPVYAAAGGNTGSFTCSAVVASQGVLAGVYRGQLINPTHYDLFDPNGD